VNRAQLQDKKKNWSVYVRD